MLEMNVVAVSMALVIHKSRFAFVRVGMLDRIVYSEKTKL